tara:strand:+ start:187 stop:873 length:687 start_codon:yes stop_codon:yes gene_type:complete
MHTQKFLRTPRSIRGGANSALAETAGYMHVLRILVLLLAQADALRVPSLSRRQIVTAARNGGLLVSTSTLLPTVASATGNMPAVQGTVTKMDGSVKKASTPAAAKAQITAGFTEVSRLFADYDAIIASGGGDGVRRSLGVVGTESPIYLIEAAFRLLFEADDTLPMEYIESVENLMRNLSSADSEAYSAIFIEFSSAKGKPADYFARSKVAVGKARDNWKELMDYLKM